MGSRTRSKVIIQLPFKVRQHIPIHLLTRNELPVIKAHAQIQQQLNMVAKQFPAVLVNRMLQLPTNILNYGQILRPLSLRQMQRLCLIIREEGIPADLPSQRSPMNQIRMEQQSITRTGHPILRLNLNHLPRSKTHHRPFLIIVVPPAILNAASHTLLQPQCIHPKVQLSVRIVPRSLRHVHHGNQRVQ